MSSVDEGESKTKLAAQKVTLLQGAVPQTRKAELEQAKTHMQHDWQSFVDDLKSTKSVVILYKILHYKYTCISNVLLT